MKMQQKLTAAEERRAQMNARNQERVQTYNRKVLERVRAISQDKGLAKKQIHIQLESRQQRAMQKRVVRIHLVRKAASLVGKKAEQDDHAFGIKLDIQLEMPKVEAPPPAIIDRLEPTRKALTLEEISQKLEKAEAKRQELLNSQKRESAESRIKVTADRRESLERAQGQRVQEKLGKRQTAAEMRRAQMVAEN